MLEKCLEEMEQLRDAAMALSKGYYEGARDFCILELSSAIQILHTFETNHE